MKHLFLDLEDTVIAPVMEGWANTHLINTKKVKQFIVENPFDFVHIFSFAIWNQEEKKRFQLFTQPRLELLYGKIGYVPTVDDDIIPFCCAVMNIHPGFVDFSTMSDFWGKQQAFRLYLRHLYKSNSTPIEVTLLDDAVYNEDFNWPDLKLTGKILNIDQMEGPEDGDSDIGSGTPRGSYNSYRSGW